MKKQGSYLPAAIYALSTLGAQIAIARKESGWTAVEFAERLGVTPQLVSRIEKGSPNTSIGTVLEVAVLVRIPLFEVESDDVRGMHRVAEHERLRLQLLPSRTRRRKLTVDNDF